MLTIDEIQAELDRLSDLAFAAANALSDFLTDAENAINNLESMNAGRTASAGPDNSFGQNKH